MMTNGTATKLWYYEAIKYCPSCQASVNETDRAAGECTQCHEPINRKPSQIKRQLRGVLAHQENAHAR